jgi:hypothetical protein
MEAFERQECQAAILCEKTQHLIAVLLRSSLWLVFYYTKFTFFKLNGTCCRFSFINNASERRNCVYIARLFFLTWMTYHQRENKRNISVRLVYYNALQLSGYLVKLLSALLFLTLYCNFINTLYKIMTWYLCLMPLVWPYCVCLCTVSVTVIHMYMWYICTYGATVAKWLAHLPFTSEAAGSNLTEYILNATRTQSSCEKSKKVNALPKSWVFPGYSGFLPQGKLTGWVR